MTSTRPALVYAYGLWWWVWSETGLAWIVRHELYRTPQAVWKDEVEATIP